MVLLNQSDICTITFHKNPGLLVRHVSHVEYAHVPRASSLYHKGRKQLAPLVEKEVVVDGSGANTSVACGNGPACRTLTVFTVG